MARLCDRLIHHPGRVAAVIAAVGVAVVAAQVNDEGMPAPATPPLDRIQTTSASGIWTNSPTCAVVTLAVQAKDPRARSSNSGPSFHFRASTTLHPVDRSIHFHAHRRWSGWGPGDR